MPGRGAAPTKGRGLEDRVAELGRHLELDVYTQVRVGRRLWGAERTIDVILTHAEQRKSLGIECKFQDTRGTAEEKIPATIEDIRAWPIPGLVVFEGAGFTPNMRTYLISTGKAVEMEDLESWLRLYFGLPILPTPPRTRASRYPVQARR